MELLLGQWKNGTRYSGPICAHCGSEGNAVAFPLRAGMTVVLCRGCIIAALAALHPLPLYDPARAKPSRGYNDL